jgi:hypothetical protein
MAGCDVEMTADSPEIDADAAGIAALDEEIADYRCEMN